MTSSRFPSLTSRPMSGLVAKTCTACKISSMRAAAEPTSNWAMCSKNRSKSSKTSGAGSIRAMSDLTHQFSWPRAAWRLAARPGGQVRPHFIPGDGFACCQNLCPALVSHPMEVIVQLDLVDGLGYGIDDESVGGLAGTRGRRRHTSLQVIINADGGRRHGSLPFSRRSTVAPTCYFSKPSRTLPGRKGRPAKLPRQKAYFMKQRADRNA